MGKIVSEFSNRGFPVKFLDFKAHFDVSNTRLWAKGDQIHLSDDIGLPLVRDLVVTAINDFKDKERAPPPDSKQVLIEEYIWRGIRKHAIGSRYPSFRDEDPYRGCYLKYLSRQRFLRYIHAHRYKQRSKREKKSSSVLDGKALFESLSADNSYQRIQLEQDDLSFFYPMGLQSHGL